MKKNYRKTKRLIIRFLEEKDYDVWKRSYEDNDVPQNTWDLARRPPSRLTKAVFKKTLRIQKKLRDEDKAYYYGVFKNSGEMIGFVCVMDIARQITQTAYIGYAIYNNHWGQGFGKESTLALIDIAFKDLKLHRIEAGIEPYNRRSIMLARSIGLRKEGLKKRVIYLRDEWHDLSMYSATCEDFGIKWKEDFS